MNERQRRSAERVGPFLSDANAARVGGDHRDVLEVVARANMVGQLAVCVHVIDRVSSVMLRLLRLTSLKYPLVFGLSCGPRERCMNGAKRVGSGRPIDSTLMTSAPWSARILVPYGPANTHVRSIVDCARYSGSKYSGSKYSGSGLKVPSLRTRRAQLGISRAFRWAERSR